MTKAKSDQIEKSVNVICCRALVKHSTFFQISCATF